MNDGLSTREEFLNRLENETNVFADPKVKDAFYAIDRNDFVPEDYQIESYEDYALPIGYGQTISQPTTVAFMLELLEVKGGDRILDIGSGSGYTTALLAHMTGETGEVWGVEAIDELVIVGQENLAKYKFKNAHIEIAKEELGLVTGGLFDKILVNASANELPAELLKQLKPEGILVIPIQDSLYKIKKTSSGEMEEIHFSGFSFAPLAE